MPKIADTKILAELEQRAQTREKILSWIEDIRKNGWHLPSKDLNLSSSTLPVPLVSAIRRYIDDNLREILLASKDEFDRQWEDLLDKAELEANEIVTRVNSARPTRP